MTQAIVILIVTVFLFVLSSIIRKRAQKRKGNYIDGRRSPFLQKEKPSSPKPEVTK